MAEYNFQKELENSILNADPNLDKKELLQDVFKSYVSKCLELLVSKSNTIPYGAITEVQGNLIREFRAASLAEYQLSVEQYETLFKKAMEEICTLAAAAHPGVDTAIIDQNQILDVNAEGLAAQKGFVRNDSGLFVPAN